MNREMLVKWFCATIQHRMSWVSIIPYADLRTQDVHTMQAIETLCGLTLIHTSTQGFHQLENLNFLKKEAFLYTCTTLYME